MLSVHLYVPRPDAIMMKPHMMKPRSFSVFRGIANPILYNSQKDSPEAARKIGRSRRGGSGCLVLCLEHFPKSVDNKGSYVAVVSALVPAAPQEVVNKCSIWGGRGG